jgi:hypothetical protein
MTHLFPPAPKGARSNRDRRMFESFLRGAGPDAIAEEEDLSTAEVETVVREELGRRWAVPIADFTKMQIARLDRLCLVALDQAQRGELKAVDRALKVFDRLDRYHGFSRASPVVKPYGEEERQRLFAKIESIVTRLDADSPRE